jgi:integrase/recombinase XerD
MRMVMSSILSARLCSMQDIQHILGHHSILTTNRYTHLTTQTEALATQRIDALMGRFNLGWGAVK